MPDKILKGESVCSGTVSAPVRVLLHSADASSVLPGEIVVVPSSRPEFAVGLLQACGLICENGGVVCHLCIVALELGIPCVTEVHSAISTLSTGMKVTLDGDRGLVIYGE